MSVDESVVIIKQFAYHKMLLHMLRFGTKLNKPEEIAMVFGILLGYFEENVIVKDIIPITHGSAYDVELKPEHFAQLSAIAEELLANDLARVVIMYDRSDLADIEQQHYVVMGADPVNEFSLSGLKSQLQQNPERVGVPGDALL